MNRHVFLALLMAVGALVPAATAPAAPATRDAAVAAYQSVLDAEDVPVGWTGSGCTAGTESAASQAATLSALNTLRDFAGLAPVQFDPDMNAKALAAATMMRAANALSHSPGTDWPCYTAAGAEGAGRANLYLGAAAAEAMVGYVDDAGVDTLGHRRWVLDPVSTTFGTGSTDRTNALVVMGGPTAPTNLPFVAWPPPGWVPSAWIFQDWSIAIQGNANASAATVSVRVDGQPVAVSGVGVIGGIYGTGETLRWLAQMPSDLGSRQKDTEIDVVVGNVVVDGQPRSFSYALHVIPTKPIEAARFARLFGPTRIESLRLSNRSPRVWVRAQILNGPQYEQLKRARKHQPPAANLRGDDVRHDVRVVLRRGSRERTYKTRTSVTGYLSARFLPPSGRGTVKVTVLAGSKTRSASIRLR